MHEQNVEERTQLELCHNIAKTKSVYVANTWFKNESKVIHNVNKNKIEIVCVLEKKQEKVFH